MVVLFTDYKCSLYTGQVIGAITALDPSINVINAVDDLPEFNVKSSAYLLKALINYYPKWSVILAIVDPGVGGNRLPICFKYDGRWFVGPDNGIFSKVLSNCDEQFSIYEINVLRKNISHTFHGRDVFAPMSAHLAKYNDVGSPRKQVQSSQTLEFSDQWQGDLHEVVYIDGFGNCLTGISKDARLKSASIWVGNIEIRNANTFSDVRSGQAFWYFNSIGLLEIAVNQGSAADEFGWTVSTSIHLENRK